MQEPRPTSAPPAKTTNPSFRAVTVALAVAFAIGAAVLRPWEGRAQPGFPLAVKTQDIFACRSLPILQKLYPLLRTGDFAGFVREGQRLTSQGDCVYLGRGVRITGFAAADTRLVKVRRDPGDRDWLAPRAVFDDAARP